jgi:hypothetical protein
MWSDPFVESLRPYSKLVFVYLWTNGECNQAGLYQISRKRIEFDTGVEITEDIRRELWQKAQMHLDENIVWVLNFFKRQCANEKFVIGALRCLSTIPLKFHDNFLYHNREVIQKYSIDLAKYGLQRVPKGYGKGMHTHTVSDTDTDTDTVSDTEKGLFPSKTHQNDAKENQNGSQKQCQMPVVYPEGFVEGNGHGVLFDRFWTAYPRKVGKKTAKEKFLRIMKCATSAGALTDVMILAIDKHKKSKQWKDNNGEFIPHPTTWLNQERWEDCLKPEIETTGKGVNVYE